MTENSSKNNSPTNSSVQEPNHCDKRDFNFYSAYDWTVWTWYGSAPFNPEPAKNADIAVAIAPAVPSQVQTSNSNNVEVSSTEETPTAKKRSRAQPRESTAQEKQFFESTESVLINSGIGFLLGSNLAYIIETRTTHDAGSARSAFHPNQDEFVSKHMQGQKAGSQELVVDAQKQRPSALPRAVPPAYRQITGVNAMKPELKGIEDRARKVAMQGVQTAAMAAAFTVALELNDHYFERKKDHLTFITAGGVAGFAHGILHRSFSPILILQSTVILAGVGGAYSLINENFLEQKKNEK